MNSPLQVRFTYTRDEYVRAMQRHYKTALHFWRDVIAGTIALIAGAYLIATGFGWTAWILTIAGIVLLSMIAYARFLLPRMIYSSQPKLKQEYDLTFSDEGIGFKTDGIDSTLQWSLYHSWLSDTDFYILYHGKRDVTVMPRRALDTDDNERFRQMLEKHIGSAIL